MSQEKDLKVSVSFSGTTVEFKGSPENVVHSLTEFLSKEVPSLDLARKISVNYSVSDLIKTFGDFVKITPEGPRVWATDKKLSDKEVVLLQLVATRIAHDTGKVSSDALTLSEMQEITGVKPKSISSRLSEVLKIGYVDRQAYDSGAKYRITTAGINWLGGALSKKAR